jgi:O-antigen ligase
LTLRLPDRRLLLLQVAFLASVVLVLAWVAVAYELSVPVALILPAALLLVGATIYLPLTGVCVALLAAPFDNVAAGGASGAFSLTPSEAILFVVAAAAAPRLLSTISLARIPAALYAFGGLIVFSLLGVFVAIDTLTVVKIVLDWLAFGIVSLYVSQLPFDRIKALAFSLAISGGILGATAIGSFASQKSIAEGAEISNRAEGSFAHPTALAFFLILSFPTAFAIGLAGPRRWRLPMLAAGILAFLGLLATQTRGSVIGAAIAIVWMMVKWPPFRRFAGAAILIVAVVLVFNVGGVSKESSFEVVGERVSDLSLDSKGDQRLKIWETTPKIIAKHPLLGIGQDNFPVVSPSFGLADVGGVPFDHAHDLFLTIAVELGLPALVVLLFFIGYMFRSSARALRDRGSPYFPYAVGAVTSLLAMLINSITEYPPRQNLIMATIMIMVGLVLAFERLAGEGKRTASTSS